MLLTLVTMALAAVAGLGFLYAYQERLVYFPSRALQGDPGMIGLSFESLRLPTDDGVDIHGWWIPADPARATVLFLHGNAGNISHRLPIVEELNRLGLSVLLIDYRGYGQSAGVPSEAGTYLDAEAAWRYLTEGRGIAGSEIIVLGRSLGGGVATWVAEKYSPAGLWLESTFVSMAELGRVHYPWLPVSWLLRIHYPNHERMTGIRVPTVLAHSPGDEIVPFEHSERLYRRAAAEQKWLVRLEGGHNADYWRTTPRYRQCWSDFADIIRGGRPRADELC